jgi:capsid protein
MASPASPQGPRNSFRLSFIHSSNPNFLPPKRVTVDAGREAQQNRADVEVGLKRLSDHFRELGADFGEKIERRASDAKLILETAAKHGVPVDMLWKPS